MQRCHPENEQLAYTRKRRASVSSRERAIQTSRYTRPFFIPPVQSKEAREHAERCAYRIFRFPNRQERKRFSRLLRGFRTRIQIFFEFSPARKHRSAIFYLILICRTQRFLKLKEITTNLRINQAGPTWSYLI